MRRIFPFLVCLLLSFSLFSAVTPAYAQEAPPQETEEETSASTGMFDETASLGKTIMDGVWALFGIYVPGFSFTFGQMWLGVLLCAVSILVIRMIFGFGGSGSGGMSSRTSSTSNPKISKERRHDEY